MAVNATTFEVKKLLEECASAVSPKEGVALCCDAAGAGDAHTDEALVRRMVINLLSNAVKFTAAGSITLTARREEGQLVIAVADTGRGIPEDQIERIFSEFRQVEGGDKAQGHGLGLSIVKRFAELLGGTIGVESEVDKGSAFMVRVPIVYKA